MAKKEEEIPFTQRFVLELGGFLGAVYINNNDYENKQEELPQVWLRGMMNNYEPGTQEDYRWGDTD